MTLSDVAILDKEKRKKYNIVPETFQFDYCRGKDNEKAWSYNQNSRLNAWEVSSIIVWGFSHEHGNHIGYIVNNDIIFWTVPHVAI